MTYTFDPYEMEPLSVVISPKIADSNDDLPLPTPPTIMVNSPIKNTF